MKLDTFSEKLEKELGDIGETLTGNIDINVRSRLIKSVRQNKRLPLSMKERMLDLISKNKVMEAIELTIDYINNPQKYRQDQEPEKASQEDE